MLFYDGHIDKNKLPYSYVCHILVGNFIKKDALSCTDERSVQIFGGS